jgi:hypothetical protein
MDFNFKFLGNCDITNLKDKINQLSEQDWLEHQLRQNIFEAHVHTNTLEILWDINSFRNNTIGKVHHNFFKLDIDTFLRNIEPFYKNHYGNGYFIRVLITRLKAKSVILPHIDEGTSLSNCKRTHIAIQTTPDCTFNVGDEVKHLKEGEIWEINNSKKKHSVVNKSNQDRIHIILDYYLENNQ